MSIKHITKYIPVSEAAHQLGVPHYKVQREIKKGNLPAIRVGWQYLIKKSDLKKYMEE